MLKQRPKCRKKSGRKPVAEMVRDMAASGLVEDEIALRLNIDKNQLRARYIDAIKRGKRMAASSKARATQLSRTEQHAINAILSTINSEWHTPDGNDLWPGLHGGGARDAPDAVAAWLLNGARFVTTGLTTNFSPERLREFAEVKAAAEELLEKVGPNKTGPTS